VTAATLGHVFLIEDDAHLRDDLAGLLRFSGFTVQSFPSAEHFAGVSIPAEAAVILSDVRMPGISGVEMQARLPTTPRALPIIFMSGESSRHEIVEGMRNGALDFLLKPFRAEQLVSAVTKALAVDSENIAKTRSAERLAALLSRLSPREREVFHLLAKGLNNQELVKQLGISIETVKQYKQEVMRKCDCRSLAELIETAS
jgi:RNA polymerase sigma factor (sigma-70 family)